MSTETRKDNYKLKQNRYSKGKKSTSNQLSKGSYSNKKSESRGANNSGNYQKGKKNFYKKSRLDIRRDTSKPQLELVP